MPFLAELREMLFVAAYRHASSHNGRKQEKQEARVYHNMICGVCYWGELDGGDGTKQEGEGQGEQSSGGRTV